MLDALGILQHHDAVSGTAKQAVANDYNKRLYKSMEVNNIYYNNLIAEKVFKQYGFTANDWQQCMKTNSTYLDCPIGQRNISEGQSVNLAVHNPSSLDLKSVKVAIAPDSNFVVSVYKNFNVTRNGFEPTLAEKSCIDDHLENGQQVRNCHMEIEIDIPAQGVALIQMNYTTVNREIPTLDLTGPSAIHVDPTIEGRGLRVTYTGMDKTESTIKFDVFDQLSGVTEQFEFSMRYYESYSFMIDNDYMNSGAYVFHPMEGQLHPFPYGDVKDVSI